MTRTPVPGCKVWHLSDAAETWLAEHHARLQAKHPGKAMSPYDVALNGFGGMPLRHPYKYEMLLFCWMCQWPHFLLEKDGVVNHWAARMAKGFCQFDVLDLLGCASSGKTQAAAAYGYTLWKANPFNTSVFLSTTSAEAGESRTWGAVKDWHKTDRYKVGKRIESLHLITLDEEIRDEDGVKERDFRDVVKCVNIKSGNEGRNVVASIVGRKNRHVVWICDEMSHMDIGILDARPNLGSNDFNQFIGLGNAPKEGTPLYIDACPFGDKYPDGWASVEKDRDIGWPTKAGYCLYFNGDKSPNFSVPGKEPFGPLMNTAKKLRIEKLSFGADTPSFWEQFYGFPPSVDISDKVLTHKLLEMCHAFDSALWLDTDRKVFGGLDLGFRKGGDPCVLHFGAIGKETGGKTILDCEPDGIPLTPKQGSPLPFEQQIAKLVIDECHKRKCTMIAADVTGDGGIMVQAIEHEARQQGYKLTVLAVSFSGSASDAAVVPGDKRSGKELFDRKVSELWMMVRLCVQSGLVRGMEARSRSVTQLCARRYQTDEKKRFCVEKKEEMKLRLRHSPDFGDATALLVFLAVRNGLSVGDVPKPGAHKSPEAMLASVSGKIERYSGHTTGRYVGR